MQSSTICQLSELMCHNVTPTVVIILYTKRGSTNSWWWLQYVLQAAPQGLLTNSVTLWLICILQAGATIPWEGSPKGATTQKHCLSPPTH